MAQRRRHSPEFIARSKATKAGIRFERVTVQADLRANGYTTIFAHQSKGKVDHMAWKPGQILVVGARVTSPSKTNPSFTDKEWDGVWELAAESRPGFEIVPLFATADHQNGPVRYLRLTGPSSLRGPGRRPPWEPFELDLVEAALGSVA